ncbi:MAG: RnfABCDGE type electron transport complex subunit D [Eubacteriales bacterium]|nr:RnfABCDGE type electron transport complex subunit D [Eubacteriales bacterium]
MKVKTYFMHQKMMTKVLLALLPIIIMSTWLYGWRVISLLAVTLIAGIAAEYLVLRLIQKDKTKVTEACLVSCVLFTLTLPPATPYYIAIIGIVFGIVFGKAVFGGFGRNIFNPALVGRAFIYIAFPRHLALRWTEPFTDFPGGFFNYAGAEDLITSATPLINLKEGAGASSSLKELIFGLHPGTIGETARILIIVAAIYLIWTKTAAWKIMLSTLGSAALMAAIFNTTGALTEPFYYYLFSGGLLFGAVFMATDPVSAPKNEQAKWIFGALVGIFTMTIRAFSLFAEGVMFAILLANSLTPLLERNLQAWQKERQLKAKAKAERQAKTPEQGGSKTPAKAKIQAKGV